MMIKCVLFCVVLSPLRSKARWIKFPSKLISLLHSNANSSLNPEAFKHNTSIITSSENVNSSEHNISLENVGISQVQNVPDNAVNEAIKFDETSSISNQHQSKIIRLSNQYKSKFVCTTIPYFPHCDIYLCGTLHIAKKSSDMIADVISTLKPHYVLVELCEGRSDSIFETEMMNVTLYDVFKATIEHRSVKVLGTGLLSWMQTKAAKLVGSKVGEEISTAYRMAVMHGAAGVILGDRSYSITLERVIDKLKGFQLVKLCFLLMYETLTMQFSKLAEYVKKTEDDDKFIQEEVKMFRQHLPVAAEVLIDERDEYLAQSIIEIARVGFGPQPMTLNVQTSGYMSNLRNSDNSGRQKGRIVAVLGAGHIDGVKRWLSTGGVTEARLKEISSSSKQVPTWPGKGVFYVVDPRQVQ